MRQARGESVKTQMKKVTGKGGSFRSRVACSGACHTQVESFRQTKSS